MLINLRYASNAASLSAIWGLLAVSILWGTSYGVSKPLLMHFSVQQILFLRFVIAFVALGILIIKNRSYLVFLHSPQPYVIVGVSTGIVLTSIFLAETWALMSSHANQVAVLISLCVLFTPILERIWLKAVLPPLLWMYGLGSVIGVILITGEHSLNINFSSGTLLILLAAILRAVMVVSCRKAFSTYELQTDVVTFIQLSIVTTVSLILVIQDASHPSLIHTLKFASTQDYLSIVYLALGCTLLAFILQNHSVKSLDASHASLLMGTEPLFGLLFSVIFLQETLLPLQWAGSLLIVCATMIACYQFSNHNRTKLDR
ncbi:DMT family transporter [Vibrio sp. 10N.261.51.F12]|uniref:DMT family transporter n=1 Tax=Vibrio sp. 10N.261.51.F12 TaxID=3229679 RepID=UPI0035543BBC